MRLPYPPARRGWGTSGLPLPAVSPARRALSAPAPVLDRPRSASAGGGSRVLSCFTWALLFQYEEIGGRFIASALDEPQMVDGFDWHAAVTGLHKAQHTSAQHHHRPHELHRGRAVASSPTPAARSCSSRATGGGKGPPCPDPTNPGPPTSWRRCTPGLLAARTGPDLVPRIKAGHRAARAGVRGARRPRSAKDQETALTVTAVDEPVLTEDAVLLSGTSPLADRPARDRGDGGVYGVAGR